ncbi:MAG: c-type cytochrome [Rhodobacteraceae bacterium]|nr:c-type cytochrome [Paracoccaceae bacterium]
MSPRPDPLETMTPADKLLRVGTFACLGLLLLFVVVSSFSAGPDRPASAQLADTVTGDTVPAETDSAEAAPQVEMAEATAEPSATAAQDATTPEPVAEMSDREIADVVDQAASGEPAQIVSADREEAPQTMESANWLDDALLASADIARGESAFRQCSTCHQYAAERNAGGPHLVGIVGRPVGAVENWRYSTALQEAGGIWTPERLNAWLTNPNAYLPGNRMSYPGVRSEQERLDIIAFLAAQS